MEAKFKYTYLPVYLLVDLFKITSWVWKRRIWKGTIGILIENLVVADGIPRRSSRKRVWGLSALVLDFYTHTSTTRRQEPSQNIKGKAS